jgi:SAM-dependent methyltransferase
MFYNFGLSVYEFFIFGRDLGWLNLRFQYFREYFFTRIRSIVLKESQSVGYSEDNFIYGETPCITIREILEIAGAKPGDEFIDLGCGRGLTVFYAYYLKKLKAAGYDLIPTFINKAHKIKSSLKVNGIEFFKEDLLKADISSAKIVYVAGTTFSDDFIELLTKKLHQVPKGAVIVTLSYPLSSVRFSLFREQQLYFSWGKNTVYFHKKK